MKTLIFTIILFFGSFVAWGYFNNSPLPLMKISAPSQGNIKIDIRVTGKVVNNRVVKVAALTDGKLQSLVSIGDKVKINDSLVIFNDEEQRANLTVINAELNLQNVISSYKKKEFLKLQHLFKKGVLAKEKFEEVREELTISRAKEKVIQEKIKIRQIRLKQTQINAPFSGVITDSLVDSGQWVEQGTHLLTIASSGGKQIEANIDISDLMKIKLGTTVIVQSDSHPEYSWQEVILKKTPTTNNNVNSSNTFAIKLSLGKKAPYLLLNQQVDIKIPHIHKSDIMKLPVEAVIHNIDGSKSVATLIKKLEIPSREKRSITVNLRELWCELFKCPVLDEKMVKIKNVKTGVEDFTHIEIVTGLEVNDMIALPTNVKIIDGMRVNIKGKAK